MSDEHRHPGPRRRARSRPRDVAVNDGKPATGNASDDSGPKLRKLRFAFIIGGLLNLALISTVFGMMMAVAQDLPSLETRNEFKAAKNSTVYDVKGRKIATLTGEKNRILIPSEQISLTMKHAVVAIEDRRFYDHSGVDYRGIARALWQDIRRQRAEQGASTITQQFVKNALLAHSNRTVFQKLREAALAYHLERKWSKDKILTEYLNTVYFGEGAYGIESAARTYFGVRAVDLTVPQAALLAGVIASPSTYDPAINPASAKARRDLVLANMRDEGLIAQADYKTSVRTALPARSQIRRPGTESLAPYFTEYLTQQLVERYGAGTSFGGGLKIRTTLDLDLQRRAEDVVASTLGGIGPSAAAVVIDNDTGGIRAMVGGSDFKKQPFNLATQGHRQPGSAFKPFTLVTALDKGISPGSVWSSQLVAVKGREGKYVVHNYEDQYQGPISLAAATTTSDNSVFAQVGTKVGTDAIARHAEKMGIETPISRNTAMILGGLRLGVTPLEMAHAFETIAQKGELTSGTLAPSRRDPVAVWRVEDSRGRTVDKNETIEKRAIPKSVATTATSILQTVVSGGTGKQAAIGDFAAGKTGTTENYADAWFVGFTDQLTAAVWVGYPQGARQMETEFGGQPVAGGTFPAIIWREIMLAAKSKPSEGTSSPEPSAPSTSYDSSDAPAAQPKRGKQSGSNRRQQQAPESQSPADNGPAPQEPAPQQPAGDDGGDSGGTGGGTGGAGTQ